MSDKYDIGNYLPLFILLNSDGDVIVRWDGFSTGEKFVREFNNAMSDLTTIKERESRLSGNPTLKDFNMLAKYYEDIKDYRKAVDLFRKGKEKRPSREAGYDMKIFENFANGAWNDVFPFDSAQVAADIVYDDSATTDANMIKMVRMISNCARKTENTDKIKKYLVKGIELTKDAKNKKAKENYYLFGADYALYIAHDTAKAIAIKKKGMGDNWEKNLKNYYPFARYCFDRRINIDESYNLLMTLTEKLDDGTYKGRVYSTLAQIEDYRGNKNQALKFVEQAMQQDPDNEYYPEQYEKLL